MEIPDQLVSEIKAYIAKRPLIEVYSLFTRITLAEAESRAEHVPDILATKTEGER